MIYSIYFLISDWKAWKTKRKNANNTTAATFARESDHCSQFSRCQKERLLNASLNQSLVEHQLIPPMLACFSSPHPGNPSPASHAMVNMSLCTLIEPFEPL
jgi:hypothetical protein